MINGQIKKAAVRERSSKQLEICKRGRCPWVEIRPEAREFFKSLRKETHTNQCVNGYYRIVDKI